MTVKCPIWMHSFRFFHYNFYKKTAPACGDHADHLTPTTTTTTTTQNFYIAVHKCMKVRQGGDVIWVTLSIESKNEHILMSYPSCCHRAHAIVSIFLNTFFCWSREYSLTLQPVKKVSQLSVWVPISDQKSLIGKISLPVSLTKRFFSFGNGS